MQHQAEITRKTRGYTQGDAQSRTGRCSVVHAHSALATEHDKQVSPCFDPQSLSKRFQCDMQIVCPSCRGTTFDIHHIRVCIHAYVHTCIRDILAHMCVNFFDTSLRVLFNDQHISQTLSTSSSILKCFIARPNAKRSKDDHSALRKTIQTIFRMSANNATTLRKVEYEHCPT